MAKTKTKRYAQRHRALDVLFEADEKGAMSSEEILDLLKQRQVLSTAQVPIGEFGAQIVTAYAENIIDVDTIIEAASRDWALSRMNVVDRTIVRLAAAEFMFLGTGRALVISQWADLAREFSTDRSVGFVMGLLNRIFDIKQRERGEKVLSQREREEAQGMAAGEAETLAALAVNAQEGEGAPAPSPEES